jgi:hypothetical protein
MTTEGPRDLEQTFRAAVQNPSSKHPDTPLYKNITQRIVQSALGWIAITFMVTFVFLYLTNPPIVQCHRSDNDISKPPPNTTSVFIYSTLAAIAVLVCTRFAGKSTP